MCNDVGDRGSEKATKQPHAKQIMPYHLSPRCGAITRTGMPCKSPAVKGRKRCRMHGGAKGSGAPKGNQNALKHGFYSAEPEDLKLEAIDSIFN